MTTLMQKQSAKMVDRRDSAKYVNMSKHQLTDVQNVRLSHKPQMAKTFHDLSGSLEKSKNQGQKILKTKKKVVSKDRIKNKGGKVKAENSNYLGTSINLSNDLSSIPSRPQINQTSVFNPAELLFNSNVIGSLAPAAPPFAN